MKYFYLIVLSLVICHEAKGQYEINLENVKAEPLRYLNNQSTGPKGKEIRVNNVYLEEGGKPVLPAMGEFHYLRMDHRYWRDALLKMKSSGINIVSTYVLWSLHEEVEGEQNWSGNNNLRQFIQLCSDLGLKVHIRIGPYCNAEIKNGALPEWLVNNKNLETRSNDPLYLNYTRKWYQSVFKQIEGLLYADGGPIIAVQLENEYVKQGMVIDHLMALKKIAIEEGFKVPLYTMTHWMDSEYPKGEIIPYAGFYIETPWITNHGKMTEPTNFEYFTYNRLSDNIGTDIIKIEGDIESFDGSKSDSPFFTCEVGVGAPGFYNRRAIIPEGMAGENINLRLGTGVNLMGYYMYVGGTNPRGKNSLFGTGPYLGYDYQAPIREFGTLGLVMKETKKLNYFMNDFGSDLAPMLAYLPVSNQDRDNLQWAVRSDGKAGYLFVSNHLYRYDRPQFDKVQFKLKMKEEELTFPRQPISIINKSYFLWPFNLDLNGVTLKYGTAQPISIHQEGEIKTYFFFQDDAISAEYLIKKEGVKSVIAKGSKVTMEKNCYFISEINPGMNSVITILKNNGEKVNLITLTEEQSDYFWKGKIANKHFVGISTSSLLVDNDKIILTAEQSQQQISLFLDSKKGFVRKDFDEKKEEPIKVSYTQLGPMNSSKWVSTKKGKSIERTIDLNSFAEVSEAKLRFDTENKVKVFWNDKIVTPTSLEGYQKADVKDLLMNNFNTVRFEAEGEQLSLVGEIEVLYKNGVRKVWNTDNTWLTASKKPVEIIVGKGLPNEFAAEERLGLFRINIPQLDSEKEEIRVEVSFDGDVATAYIGQEPFTDFYNNGSSWILGLTRKKVELANNPLVLRIKGFGDSAQNIFLEKHVDRIRGQFPAIRQVKGVKDYTYIIEDESSTNH